MTALAERIPVVQGSPEWLEARLDLIGASEAAAALGLSRWESKVGLWARKLRLVGPVEQTPRMRFGLLVEPIIATLAEEALDLAPGSLRRVNQLRRSIEHPFMGASLDRVGPGRRIVELKWSERADDYGEPGTDEVPDEVLVQALHQLIVTGYEAVDVALLTGPPPVRLYRIKRDADAEAAIIERERDFWHYVETRTEPPIDGSEATRAYLAARYPRETPGETIVVPDDDELRGTLARLAAVKSSQAEAKAARELLENQIKAAMGTAERLEAPGLATVTLKAAKDTETVDWKALAQVYGRSVDTLVAQLRTHAPDLRIEGIDVSTDVGLVAVHDALRSIYTQTKPGSRRFLARFEGQEED